VQLFVAAPAEGPGHSPFTISTIARTGNESGDSDTVVFERPEREKEDEE
jgi:hypothetical protein